jgi:hypothetical protein
MGIQISAHHGVALKISFVVVRVDQKQQHHTRLRATISSGMFCAAWHTNETGPRNSFGNMKNYRYIIDYIEKNHEKFVVKGTVTTFASVRKLAKRFANN